jgi:hypothetical protein
MDPVNAAAARQAGYAFSSNGTVVPPLGAYPGGKLQYVAKDGVYVYVRDAAAGVHASADKGYWLDAGNLYSNEMRAEALGLPPVQRRRACDGIGVGLELEGGESDSVLTRMVQAIARRIRVTVERAEDTKAPHDELRLMRALRIMRRR